jgi:CRISPR-associated protein Cmr6
VIERDVPPPLWRSVAVDQQDPHLGLLYERFPRLLSQHGGEYAIDKKKGHRKDWLVGFVRQANRAPVDGLLRRHAQLESIVEAYEGSRRVYVTRGRLVVGLGNPHPSETGFSLDHRSGWPVLSGSSVKGLARAGARLLDRELELAPWFGEGPLPGDESSGRAGAVAFLDALPDASRAQELLEVDVMTPHTGLDKDENVPRDSRAPVPIPFLVVSSGVPFVFRLVPVGQDGAEVEALKVVWSCLDAALEFLGAGGKTAVGYGQMVPQDGGSKEPTSTSEVPQPGPDLAQARQLASRIQRNNAASEVPRLLAALEPHGVRPEVRAIAGSVAKQLDRKWLRGRDQEWAAKLLAFVES